MFNLKQMMLPLSLLVMCKSVSAFADTVNVQNTGSGVSLQQAIDNAVRRSIEQVKGVSMTNVRVSQTDYKRDNDSSSSYSKESNTGQRVTTHGTATYRILTERCADGECRVRLSVDVQVPDGYERQKKLKALNKNRRTIAIKPFTGPKGREFTRDVEAYFVKDRKFKILTDLNSDNLDYVLRGQVLEAYTHKKVIDNSRTVELTGEYIKDVQVSYKSKVLVEYKLIDRVNQQVKWSAVIPTTSSRNNLSLLVNIGAEKVFKQLKDNIYPLVLIKNKDGSLALNSGGDTVKQGQYLDVFKMGEMIIDPVTKERLGRNETKVARVQVTRILPKVAFVKVVSGSTDSIEKNAIVRKIATALTSKGKAKPKAPVEEKKSTRVSF